MEVRHGDYDAPPADVHAMLTDPAFRDEVCAAWTCRLGVSVDRGAAAARRSRRDDRPGRSPPRAARRSQQFVGERTRVSSREHWTCRVGGAPDRDPGQARRIAAASASPPTGVGTTETFHGRAPSRSRWSAAAGKRRHELFIAGMDTEQAVGSALAGRRPSMRFEHEIRTTAHRTRCSHAGRPGVPDAGVRGPARVRHDVSVEPRGAGMSVVVDQTQPSRGIPSFAQKVVGDEIRIVQREEWDDGSRAALRSRSRASRAASTAASCSRPASEGSLQQRERRRDREARRCWAASSRRMRRRPAAQGAVHRAADRPRLARRRPLAEAHVAGSGSRSAGTNVSLIERGEVQRSRFAGAPALSLVPEARAPPNGCWPTTAPVGLSLT